MKKRWIILLVVSIAFNLGVVSIFGYHVFAGRMRTVEEYPSQSVHTDFMRRKLGISKEQAKDIEMVVKRKEIEILPLERKLMEKREEIFEMARSGKVDNARIEKILAGMSKLQMDIERKSLDIIIEIGNNMACQQKE